MGRLRLYLLLSCPSVSTSGMQIAGGGRDTAVQGRVRFVWVHLGSHLWLEGAESGLRRREALGKVGPAVEHPHPPRALPRQGQWPSRAALGAVGLLPSLRKGIHMEGPA